MWFSFDTPSCQCNNQACQELRVLGFLLRELRGHRVTKIRTAVIEHESLLDLCFVESNLNSCRTSSYGRSPQLQSCAPEDLTLKTTFQT